MELTLVELRGGRGIDSKGFARSELARTTVCWQVQMHIVKSVLRKLYPHLLVTLNHRLRLSPRKLMQNQDSSSESHVKSIPRAPLTLDGSVLLVYYI
jgi:hypothetical protein